MDKSLKNQGKHSLHNLQTLFEEIRKLNGENEPESRGMGERRDGFSGNLEKGAKAVQGVQQEAGRELRT